MIPSPQTPKQRRVLMRQGVAVRLTKPTLGRLENWMTAHGLGLGASYSTAIDRLIELASAATLDAGPEPARADERPAGLTIHGYPVGDLVTLRGPHGERYRAQVLGPSGAEGIEVEILTMVFRPHGFEAPDAPEPLSGRLCVLPEHLEPFPAGSPGIAPDATKIRSLRPAG